MLNNSEPIEVVRALPKKPEFETQMVIFNVETKADDNPSKKSKLFERCTVYAKTDQQVTDLKNDITNGLLVEIEGRETRVPGKDKDGKDAFFSNIVVKKITPLSSGVSQRDDTEEDLPF